jgi:hypothetical protein
MIATVEARIGIAVDAVLVQESGKEALSAAPPPAHVGGSSIAAKQVKPLVI